jgi:hypothetical protein
MAFQGYTFEDWVKIVSAILVILFGAGVCGAIYANAPREELSQQILWMSIMSLFGLIPVGAGVTWIFLVMNRKREK